MRSKGLILLFLLWSEPQLHAQQLVDSLLRITRESKFDTARVEAYNELIWEYYGYKNDSALYFGKQSIELATHINYPSGLSTAHRYVGNVYELTSRYAEALHHQQKSLEISEKLGHKPGIANSLSNIGSIYERLNDYKKALEYQERSLALCIELNQKEGIAAVYGNIGNIYSSIGAKSKAMDHYQKSLEMNRELGNPYGIAVSLSNIGNIYIDRKEYQKGIDHQLEALDLRTQINHRQGMASSMMSLGKAYYQLADIPNAEKYYRESVALAKEADALPTEKEAQYGLYLIAKDRRDYQNALQFHEEYARLNDSLFNTKRNEEINNLRTQFALDQQQEELDRKSQEEQMRLKERAAADHKFQQLIIYVSVGVLFLVAVFSVFLFNRFRITNKQKNIIEKQKAIVEEKNKQITDSINYAQRIQSALLPGEEDVRKIIPESFLLFMPKDIVSGDFFWISNPDENTVVFATADCTGHGVPGGFMSMLGTSFLNEIVNEKGLRSPAKILDALREKIIVALKQQGHTQENKDGMDIVLCLLDKSYGSMTYAAANNNFYLVRNGKLDELEADKMPIGYYHDQVKPFREHTITLQKGDCVYTFTDGYADQFGGPSGKKFKYAQLEELILSQAQVSPTQQKEKFQKTIRAWQGELEQVDDICLFAFRYS